MLNKSQVAANNNERISRSVITAATRKTRGLLYYFILNTSMFLFSNKTGAKQANQTYTHTDTFK